MIAGITTPPLRTLYYAFRRYTWQSIYIRLENTSLDAELTDASLRRVAAVGDVLTPAQSMHISRYGTAPPHALAA